MPDGAFYMHKKSTGRGGVFAYNLAFVPRHLPATHFIRVHQKYVLSLFDVNTWVGNMLRIDDKNLPPRQNLLFGSPRCLQQPNP